MNTKGIQSTKRIVKALEHILPYLNFHILIDNWNVDKYIILS